MEITSGRQHANTHRADHASGGTTRRLVPAIGGTDVIDRMEQLQAIVSVRDPGYGLAVLSSWFAEPAGSATASPLRDGGRVVTPGTEFSPHHGRRLRLNVS